VSFTLTLRRHLRQLQRSVVDRPRASTWLQRNTVHTDWPEQLHLTQVVKPSSSTEAKLNNIALAASHINDRQWVTGQSFVFWHLVGQPSQEKGFQAGRSLLGGELVSDMGGGLCQLAGGLYHLALQAGLGIEERHNHSVDLYTPATRYTPLGSDAAVAWAFKDLRLNNTLSQNIAWRITIRKDAVRFALHAEHTIAECPIRFERLPDLVGGRQVRTWRARGGKVEQINHSTYKLPIQN
jgi:vancomycin resistance protein VanW